MYISFESTLVLSKMILHIHIASTVCFSLDYDSKVAKFQGVKKEREYTLFICLPIPPA